MDPDRVERMRTSLRRAKLDALVLRLPENIVMGFGVWPMNGFSYAVFTADAGPLTLIAPSCEDEEMGGCWTDDVRFFTWPRLDMPDPLRRSATRWPTLCGDINWVVPASATRDRSRCVAPSHNAGEAIVPCESSKAFLKSLVPSARWIDATALLYELRATKTEQEIARLRIAHQVAGFGLKKFHESVAPGKTEAELAAVVYEACLTRGVRLASGPPHQRVSAGFGRAEQLPGVAAGGHDRPASAAARAKSRCSNWPCASMVFGPT